MWDHLPVEVQKQIIDKKLKFYVIDAYKVAKETGMGVRINTIMQTCFFSISGVLPPDVVAVKDAPGRVVHDGTCFNYNVPTWYTDTNLFTLFANSIKWAARCL